MNSNDETKQIINLNNCIMKQFTLKSLMLLLLLLIGGGSYAWGETKKGTVKFGTKNLRIDKANVTGNDDLNNSWNIVTVGGGSFSQQPSYSQVGKKNAPATSITFTMSLPSDVKFTSFSAKFGGNNGTSGNVSLAVDGYEVGSGKVEASNVVIVTNETAATGKELKVSVTGITNGVNCYEISYTYEDSSTPQPGEVAVPTLSLAEGTYWGKQTLIIGVPEGATGVQYTLDGTDPKESKTAELITEAANLELSATTTVRAIAVDDNNNYSKEVSRTYTFAPSIANTKETAYTTAQAIEIINKTSEAQLKDEVVYVKGIVSKIVTPFDSEYGNVSFDVSVDGSTEGEQFRFYRTQKDAENKFTEDPNIEVGATVIGCGTILLYKDKKTQKEIYEFAAGNYLVEYNAPVEKVLKSIAISGEATKTTYFEGETFDPTGFVVTATYDDESTRVVTNGVTWTFDPATLTLGTTEVNVAATYGEKTASKTVAVTVTEAPKTVDIDLTKDQTTIATTDKLEWLGEYVTVTANKAAKGTNANNYYPGTEGKEYTSTRFYKNSTLTFTPAPFVVLGEITYVATASKDETAIKYADVMGNSTWTNATAKANGKIVTITPIDGTKPVSAKISDTTGGKSFTINYSLANETSLTLVAKSNDIYYATFSSASACEFAGADVFTVNVEGKNIVLNEVESKQVPANTGVLLKSAQNNVIVTRLESAPAIEGTNLLKPASEKMTEGFKFYKLAYDNFTEKTGLGFYWGAAEGGAFTVKPGLAYLAVPQAQAANVKGFSFDGTQTGINGVEATTAKGAIYNLNGQRVEKAQRGIYIQNGKKFVVK